MASQQDTIYGNWVLVEEDSMKCPVRGLGDGYATGIDDMGVGEATPVSITTLMNQYRPYVLPIAVVILGILAVNMVHGFGNGSESPAPFYDGNRPYGGIYG